MKEVPYTHRSTREVASILDPLLLQTSYDLVDALEELARKINQPDSNLSEIVQEICAAPDLFEIVLSGKPLGYTCIATAITLVRLGDDRG